MLQGRRRCDDAEPGIGYTVTKRTGNAVQRNRIRRRFKEAVRRLPGGSLARGYDYVLIGRPAALTIRFEDLISDLETGFRSLHQGGDRKRRGAPGKNRSSAVDRR